VQLSQHARWKLTASFLEDLCPINGIKVEKRGQGMEIKGLGFQQTWLVSLSLSLARSLSFLSLALSLLLSLHSKENTFWVGAADISGGRDGG